MSKQIEIEFSYSGSNDGTPSIFPQDLLADLIETRVSYAASLDLNAVVNNGSGVTSDYGRLLGTKS